MKDYYNEVNTVVQKEVDNGAASKIAVKFLLGCKTDLKVPAADDVYTDCADVDERSGQASQQSQIQTVNQGHKQSLYAEKVKFDAEFDCSTE